MAYCDFSLSKVDKQFQLSIDEWVDLFVSVPEVAPSEMLRSLLDEGVPLALGIDTEKARSELIIAPVLMEVRRRKDRSIALFSGVDFSVDPVQGLSGRCDFILSRDKENLFVRAPVMAVVEANNEDFKQGFGQCAAEMVAVQLFNKQEATEVPEIYGAVTIGNLWRFLRLVGSALSIDRRDYHIEHVGKILGILLHILSEQ